MTPEQPHLGTGDASAPSGWETPAGHSGRGRPSQRSFRPISARDTFLLLAVTFLWALCYPLIDTGLSGAPPLRFGGLRAVLAGIVLLGFSLTARRAMPSGPGVWRDLIVAGLSATAIGFAGMFLGGSLVSPGLATVLANTQPLLAALVGYFVLRESLRGLQGVALAGGFAGILVIAAPSLLQRVPNASVAGIVYVLMAAAGVAVGNVFLKRLTGRVDPFAAMAWQLLIGAVPLFLLSWLVEPQTPIHWSVSFLLSWGILSIFGTALVFMLWFALLERYELNRVNVYTFLSPVFALLLGAGFYSERLSATQWLGAALVVISASLTFRQTLASRPQSRVLLPVEDGVRELDRNERSPRRRDDPKAGINILRQGRNL